MIEEYRIFPSSTESKTGRKGRGGTRWQEAMRCNIYSIDFLFFFVSFLFTMEYNFTTSSDSANSLSSTTMATATNTSMPLTPPSPGKAIPPKHPTTAFITKLWEYVLHIETRKYIFLLIQSNGQTSIVNDPTSDSLIRWSGDDVVDVLDVAAFSHQILPQYFSHNNWPSFVRQLNSKCFFQDPESRSLDH